MTYDPLELTVRDKIRRLVGDASNDADAEYFPDATYNKVLDDHAPSWKRAAAELALSIARKIEDDPTSIGSDGDTMSWSQRTKSLYVLAERLTAEADEDDAVSATTAPAYAPVIAPVEWR